MDEQFKLSSDDTMRRLRTIAQSPGELQWRLELLSTLERMRMQSEVSMSSILQNQRKMQKVLDDLTPMELAKIINRQIDQKLKPRQEIRERFIGRLWKHGAWLLEKLLTIGIAVACMHFGIKGVTE